MCQKAIVKVISNTTGDFPIDAHYPFGKQIPNLSLNPSGQKLRYNGKELQKQNTDAHSIGAFFVHLLHKGNNNTFVS
jgi:hypothetical protein